MYLEVFITSVNVPGFSWLDSPSDSELLALSPRFISDPLPDSRELFHEILALVDDGKSTSKAIDWGTWAVRMSKDEIVEFLRSSYGEDIMNKGGKYLRTRKSKLRRHSGNKFIVRGYEVEIMCMLKLIKLVDGLDPDESYALVAQES